MRQALSSLRPDRLARLRKGFSFTSSARPGAAAAHARVLLPDSSSVSASNVPSAPEPNDVSRHAFCPSSSLRPNAPFQLLRTGRWRRAPGGFVHRPGLFSSSRPRNRFRSLRRDPVGSSQCPHCVPTVSPEFRACWCQNTAGSPAISSSSCPSLPSSSSNLTCWNMNSCGDSVALCWKIREVESRVEFDSRRGQTFDPAHFVEVSVRCCIKPSHHSPSQHHVTCPIFMRAF